MELYKNFEIVSTNLTCICAPYSVSNPRYQYWIRFLNEYSNVRYALVTRTALNHDALRELYCSAVDTSSEETLSFRFSILNRDINVTEHDLNRILHLPTKDHDPYPEIYELYGFFRGINYQGEVNLGNMYKHFLPREWNLFFHTLSRVFAPKRGGFDEISHFTQIVGFAVAYDLNINFGKLIMEQILYKMGDLDERDIMENDVHCFYPRFLQLILDDVLTDEEKYIFCDSNTRPCHYLKTNVITGLESRNLYPTIRAHITGFMFECFLDMALPLLPPGGLQALEDMNQDHALNDEAEGTNTKTQTPSNLYIDPIESPLIVGNDYQIENPQFVTQVVEPHTQTYTSSTTQLRKRKEPSSQERDGDVALRAINKDVSESHPTTLPREKKRRVELETFVSPSVPSRKDTELKKTIEQSLVPFSQQGSSITIGLSARASCNESNPSDHVQTWQNLSSEISFAQRRVSYTEDELTVASVLISMTRNETMVVDSEMNLVPLQSSEKNLGSLPVCMPLPTLPEETSMAPLKDLPSTEDGRQLDLIEEGNSRNPTAPRVTSLEEATVISFTGRQEAGSSEGMRETPTKLVSETQIPKPSENREKSDTPTESVSEKTTLTQNIPPLVSRSEFEALSQRVTTLEADVTNTYQTMGEMKATMGEMKAMLDEIKADQVALRQTFNADMVYLRADMVYLTGIMEKKRSVCQVFSIDPSSDVEDN